MSPILVLEVEGISHASTECHSGCCLNKDGDRSLAEQRNASENGQNLPDYIRPGNPVTINRVSQICVVSLHQQHHHSNYLPSLFFIHSSLCFAGW